MPSHGGGRGDYYVWVTSFLSLSAGKVEDPVNILAHSLHIEARKYCASDM